MTKYDLMIEFEEITDSMLEINLDDEFENIIIKIENFLVKRESIIEEYNNIDSNQVISHDHLNRILQKNNQLETIFEEIMLKIDTNLNGVVKEKVMSSKKKKAHRGYMNIGYQKDGYFIDKKK